MSNIAYIELLHGHLISDIPLEHQHNLEDLLVKVNKVRDAYGIPMVVTSGYRTAADQARINPKAPASKHMIGCAVDFADTDGKLKDWVKANLPLMEAIGLWFEAFESTVGWCHMQSVPPKSGNRVFIP